MDKFLLSDLTGPKHQGLDRIALVRTWWLVEELFAEQKADFATLLGPPNLQVLD